ncbi:Protein of unknown function [Tenacibaculum sp. MAR_2010_89]|uniref:DUF3103 family protein n=1 Tax=Tenacibaculum sp. MAR_2010_89 TaxID=1250198 RepID=UPI00089552A3|nr:DUF3103 family protein [Tenacibaculum sp. MAR_2010_89]SEE33648.1 Protein of unknown function [Tenacibaculum sp. MAR_2010_89]
MRIPRILLKTLLVSLLITSCNSSDELVENQAVLLESNSVNKKEVTFEFIDLMKNKSFKSKTLNMLSRQKPSVKMSNILDETIGLSLKSESFNRLSTLTNKLEEKADSDNAPDKIEILEVWLHNPKKDMNVDELLFSYAPKGNEKDWKVIEAFTINKEVVYLDPKEAPNRPVIVIETNGFETLKKEVKFMNRYLREQGVQNNRFDTSKLDLRATSSRSAGLQTTKLDKIRLNDDEEPWISGAAEVYAITSGIKDGNNKPEIKIIPMYYLDYEDKDYYPNQILLFWDDYKYQAANIQLFEKDDNVNYKSLVSTIVSGVFQIIGTVSTQPWVNVLGQVAGAIIQAMPDSWYTNNDDYVDSFYTIEKNKNYRNYYGARGNARVNLSPFFVASN